MCGFPEKWGVFREADFRWLSRILKKSVNYSQLSGLTQSLRMKSWNCLSKLPTCELTKFFWRGSKMDLQWNSCIYFGTEYCVIIICVWRFFVSWLLFWFLLPWFDCRTQSPGSSFPILWMLSEVMVRGNAANRPVVPNFLTSKFFLAFRQVKYLNFPALINSRLLPMIWLLR